MSYTWKPIVDGEDVVIGSFLNPVTASWFGGPNDAGDNGQTASGVDNTKMGAIGCALPMQMSNGVLVPDCVDSPFKTIPWQTPVVVSSIVRGYGETPLIGSICTVPLIDVGPATRLNRPLDLTPFSFQRLGGDLTTGLMHCFIRVVGGAKYLA